jgi:hypothetical protein
MKKVLLVASAILLLASCQESLEERAAREAREVTETQCPKPVGNNLLLDSIVFDIPTLTQTQYFRFTGETDNDSVISDIMKTDVKGTLIYELKNTANYKPLLGRGVCFRYIYRSNQNPEKTYIDITVNKEDYQ